MKLFNFNIGLDKPFFLIAGPCVVESEKIAMLTAEKLKDITSELKIPFIYKSSFDKANRTNINSFRGLGLSKSLSILNKVKEQFSIPILTDVHEDSPLDEITDVVDMLQTPAFLVRQTNFIIKVCSQGLPVNIKKGQFQSPWDMINVVEKAKYTNNDKILVCERGSCFGYNNLVVDMRSLYIMRNTKCPIVFDATHSTQTPGGLGKSSGGCKEHIPTLAKSAMACGISGLFMEIHPEPTKALSDGNNSLALKDTKQLLLCLQEIDNVVKKY